MKAKEKAIKIIVSCVFLANCSSEIKLKMIKTELNIIKIFYVSPTYLSSISR